MIPKQEFTAHSAFGSFPVPPLPAFSKKNIYQVMGYGGQRKRKKNEVIYYWRIGKMKNMLMILEMQECLKGCY